MSYINRFTASPTQNDQALPESAMLDSYDEMPTRLEMAIGMFTKTAISEATGTVHARSVRLPSIIHMTVEALSKYSGMSANKVIVQLLDVALDEVFQGMPSEHRAAIFQIRGEMLRALVKDDSGIPDLGGQISTQGEI